MRHAIVIVAENVTDAMDASLDDHGILEGDHISPYTALTHGDILCLRAAHNQAIL